MAYVEVDVDLDDFDIEDLLDEIERRKRRGRPKEIQNIKSFLASVGGVDSLLDVKKLSLIDKIKSDFFVQNIEKIKLEDLENIVK